MTAHPAKFSDPILDRISTLIDAMDLAGRPLVLDPFAGTGKVHYLPDVESWGVEIEPEWAHMHPRTIVANALQLPFADATFDGAITSPVYGNRASDCHDARDGSVRHTYTHTLGRRLHPDNSGTLQWGQRYKYFHAAAWTELLRAVKPEGFLILNVSNHIRNRTEQLVTEWHLQWFANHGCAVTAMEHVVTSRLREGANYQARVPWETVIVFRTPTFQEAFR